MADKLNKKGSWAEEIEVKAAELVEKVKELIQEGNIRRLIIRNAENQILVEIPLTAGVAVGGSSNLFYAGAGSSRSDGSTIG